MLQSFSFCNGTNLTIPGFAVLRCSGTFAIFGRLTLTMVRPNASFQRFYYVNGPTPVEPGRFGQCRLLTGLEPLGNPVLYASDVGTPQFGESWGPADGEWALRPNRYGFTILGQPQGGYVFAQQHEVTAVSGILSTDLWYNQSTQLQVLGQDGPLGQELTASGSLLPLNTRLVDGTKVTATWLAGQWCVTASLQPVQS